MKRTEGAPINENLIIQEAAASQLEQLGLSWEDIRGDVLDVGSGESFIAQAAKQQEIPARVFSIDIDPPESWAQLSESIRKRSVQADASIAPYVDESFDLVLARGSVGILGIPEGIRLLRPGGELRVFPLSTGLAEQWMMYYYLDEKLHVPREKTEAVMQRLISTYDEEFGTYSIEYTKLRDKALDNLKREEKLEVISRLADAVSETFGVQLEHKINDPDEREPRALLIYTKPERK